MNTIDLLTQKHPDLKVCLPDIQAAFQILRDCYREGGKVLICGNGGSAADSEHIVGELMKEYLGRRPVPEAARQKLVEAFPLNGDYLADHLQGALQAYSLVSQTAFLTAYANDVAADMMFAQQVYGYGRQGDVIIGISTSGKSANILHAMQVASVLGMQTIGLTGRDGNRLADLCDVTIRVPCVQTYDIQEQHMAVYHTLCALLEEEFFPQ